LVATISNFPEIFRAPSGLIPQVGLALDTICSTPIHIQVEETIQLNQDSSGGRDDFGIN
jgi:hypothetical protein